MPLSSRLPAVSALLYAAIMWGVIWYPYRLLAEAGVNGVVSSLVSFAIPLVLFGGLHRHQFGNLAGRWHWLILLALAAGWTNLAYVLAVLEGEVVRVLLLFYLAPLWTVIFARLLLGERLSLPGWGVLALAAGGALTMLWTPGDWPLPANRAEWMGLSAGVMFALSNVVSRHLAGVAEGARAVSVWAGVVLLTGGFLILQPASLAGLGEVAPATWGLLGAVGLCIASMTYAVQFGLARVRANQAAVIFVTELVAAAISAWWLANELLDTRGWVGAAMIVAASLFSGQMDEKKGKPHG